MTLSETKAWLRAKPGRVARDVHGDEWRSDGAWFACRAKALGRFLAWRPLDINIMHGTEFKEARMKG
jgi:hypothetical protein